MEVGYGEKGTGFLGHHRVADPLQLDYLADRFVQPQDELNESDWAPL